MTSLQPVGRVREIDGISNETLSRILPSLHDVATAYASIRSRAIAWRVLEERKLMRIAVIALAGLGLLLIAHFLPGMTWGLTDNLMSAAVLSLLLLAIRNFTNSRAQHRLRPLLTAAETIGLCSTLLTYNRWSGHVNVAWKATVRQLFSHRLSKSLVTAQAAEIFRLAVWIVAFLGILWLVNAYIDFLGKVRASELDFGYGLVGEASALLVMRLFKVSYAADLLHKSLSGSQWKSYEGLPILHREDRFSTELCV